MSGLCGFAGVTFWEDAKHGVVRTEDGTLGRPTSRGLLDQMQRDFLVA